MDLTCRYCDEPVEAQGMCATHRKRRYTGARMTAPVREHLSPWGRLLEACHALEDASSEDDIALDRAEHRLRAASDAYTAERFHLVSRKQPSVPGDLLALLLRLGWHPPRRIVRASSMLTTAARSVRELPRAFPLFDWACKDCGDSPTDCPLLHAECRRRVAQARTVATG